MYLCVCVCIYIYIYTMYFHVNKKTDSTSVNKKKKDTRVVKVRDFRTVIWCISYDKCQIIVLLRTYLVDDFTVDIRILPSDKIFFPQNQC